MDTLDAIYGRRAVKHFDPDHEMPAADLRKLLEAARAAGLPIVHVQHCGAAGEVLEEGAPGWPMKSDGSLQASSWADAK